MRPLLLIARPRRTGKARLPDGVGGRSRASAGVPWLERPTDEKLFRFNKGGKLTRC